MCFLPIVYVCKHKSNIGVIKNIVDYIYPPDIIKYNATKY